MSEGTEGHLEHAEHAQHHAHHPFDRRVAMTMAIMAAVLAGVTLVSHRGHTATLLLNSEATTFHTKAADEWNFYQAKNIRSHEYQAFLLAHAMLAKDSVRHDEEAGAMRNFWINQVDKYEGEGYWANFLAQLGKPGEMSNAKAGELEELRKKAEGLQDHARKLEMQSHELHAVVTWIDMGHLGLELALVFCAVAVLTKQRPFWVAGIVFALAGSGLAIYGWVGWRFLADIGNHG
jgi:hypothetical protein